MSIECAECEHDLRGGHASWCPHNPSGAFFSTCRTWRYALWRRWGKRSGRFVAFIGLNPSTADETINDPTVTRCINYAKRWGFDGMYMLNMFAYRATDPNDMKAATDPVGPRHDEWLRVYANRCALVVAAWGTHGIYLNRNRTVISLFRREGIDLHCLGRTKDGHPKHPLYLRADLVPAPFKV